MRPSCVNVVTSKPGTASVMVCSFPEQSGVGAKRRGGRNTERGGREAQGREKTVDGRCPRAMGTENRSANKSRARYATVTGGRQRCRGSAEPIAARRLIPVAEAGLDVDPPRGLGDKRRF